jgi:4-hydroxybenzoate polyprenyltransferase
VKIIDFIFASRPMLLLPVWSVYLVTHRLIKSDNDFSHGDGAVLAAVSLIVIGSYFINQIYDLESDRINKKLGFLQHGLLKKSEMKTAYIVTSAIPLMAGFIIDYKIGLIMIIMILLGFAYSVPPIRLKDRPLGGLIANAAAYGVLLPMAVPGYWETFDISRLYIIGCFFMMVAAGFLLTVIPDREGDRKIGKFTLATKLSDKPIILIGIGFLLVALFLSLVLNNLFLIIICAISIVLYLVALVVGRNNVILFACKFPILLLSLLAGYYFPTYLVFLLVLLILTRLYYRKRFGIEYPRLN